MPLVFKLIQRRGQRRIGCIGCSNEGWKMPNAAWFYMETVEEEECSLLTWLKPKMKWRMSWVSISRW